MVCRTVFSQLLRSFGQGKGVDFPIRDVRSPGNVNPNTRLFVKVLHVACVHIRLHHTVVLLCITRLVFNGGERICPQRRISMKEPAKNIDVEVDLCIRTRRGLFPLLGW